jgi:putative ABC transport system ATP-binding protein
VPVAVQRTVDQGLNGPTGPDVGYVRTSVGLAAIAVLATAAAAYAMNVRLFRSVETGLSTLRVRAFRHVHDLSVLTQNAERRGALVSRVTGDVDTISTFLQWGGILLLISVGSWSSRARSCSSTPGS